MALTKNAKPIGAAAAAENADMREMIAGQTTEAMTPGTRQWMIEQIKRLSPADFHSWFNHIYDTLGGASRSQEYEAAIKAKYDELTQPATLQNSPSDFTACLTYDDALAHVDELVGEQRLTIMEMIDAAEFPFELDGTHPNPYISGGEVFYPHNPTSKSSEDIIF